MTDRRPALRDGAAARAPRVLDRTLRHRRRQAAADPVLGRGPVSPGQWMEGARAHFQALESGFGGLTQALHRADGGEGLCSCGQPQCDYDLARNPARA